MDPFREVQVVGSTWVSVNIELGFMVTVELAIAVQPFAPVTVTVYVVVIEGLTVIEVVDAPVLQK